MELVTEIRKCVEEALEKGETNFAIFPFGDVGRLVKSILTEAYGIKPTYILDNHFCKYNSEIKELSFISNIKSCVLILAYNNPKNYVKLKGEVLKYIEEDRILEFSSMYPLPKFYEPKVGRHSYGPLCSHPYGLYIDSIGAFCSMAPGCTIVMNHAIEYLSTHTFMYHGTEPEYYACSYEEIEGPSYVEGIVPKGKAYKLKKSIIGNDVWIGQDVIITNGANIGNGAIVGAGSVVTKDVPDYAIAVGVPARVIRYRYNTEQIEALNRIQWWNWSDDLIRERYNDFFIDVDEFISKYDFEE